MPEWFQRICFAVLVRIPDGKHWPLWWSRSLEWIAIHTTPKDGF